MDSSVSKRCSKCREVKPLKQFSRSAKGAQGHTSACKACRRLARRAWVASYPGEARVNSKHWYANNRERVITKAAAWRRANPEKAKVSSEVWVAANPGSRRTHSRAYREANLEKVQAATRVWQRANRGRINKYNADRRARKLKACPAWADSLAIAEIYAQARALTKMTRIRHEVDHVVPLKSKIVSGLHVEFNLRAIPKLENMKKGNKVWPDMP